MSSCKKIFEAKKLLESALEEIKQGKIDVMNIGAVSDCFLTAYEIALYLDLERTHSLISRGYLIEQPGGEASSDLN